LLEKKKTKRRRQLDGKIVDGSAEGEAWVAQTKAWRRGDSTNLNCVGSELVEGLYFLDRVTGP
jgi:hypothetical protein